MGKTIQCNSHCNQQGQDAPWSLNHSNKTRAGNQMDANIKIGQITLSANNMILCRGDPKDFRISLELISTFSKRAMLEVVTIPDFEPYHRAMIGTAWVPAQIDMRICVIEERTQN